MKSSPVGLESRDFSLTSAPVSLKKETTLISGHDVVRSAVWIRDKKLHYVYKKMNFLANNKLVHKKPVNYSILLISEEF